MDSDLSGILAFIAVIFIVLLLGLLGVLTDMILVFIMG